MNVASGVLSELMSAKMEISKERFEMFTNITVRFKLQSIVWVLFLKLNQTIIPNSLRPKFKSQSKIDFWDLYVKAYFLIEIMIH